MIRGSLACLSFIMLQSVSAQVTYESFVNPPEKSQPWTYWMWVNGNATKEGVQKDLEAMDRVGINGAIVLDVDQKSPNGNTLFGNEKWQEVFNHTAQTAERLGMSIGVNNGPGYFGSGGKWVNPEMALQWVVSSETYIKGGKNCRIKLKSPGTGPDYKDIAVIAINRIDTTDATRYTIDDLTMKLRQNPGNEGGRRYSAAPYTLNQLQAYSFPGYIGYRSVITGDLDKTAPDDKIIPLNGIVNVTKYMDSDGILSWTVPSGEWTIIRFGHQWSGSCIGPVVDEVRGPEIDRMNPKALKLHFDAIVKPLKEWANSKSLSLIHTDSWEGGGLNWTPKFDSIFHKRCGYEIYPWLPVYTGRVVSSLEETERFMYDLRETVNKLFLKNYMCEFNRLLREEGLKLSAECYTTPANDMDASDYVDVPMCEFWNKDMGLGFTETMKSMSSSAQLNGRNIVAAEALTSLWEERWQMHPELMKSQVDEAFCSGVNRLVFHRYTQQNFDYPGPGEQMHKWGCKYERSNTWWDYSLPWHTYISRCQYLLQNGIVHSDILILQPEESGYLFPGLKLNGYDYTVLGPSKFYQLKADSNGMYLPNRPPYKLLVLPETKSMSLKMINKIKDLVNDGAIILGQRPLWVYGLNNYKERENELHEISDLLWGNNNENVRTVGKGKVISGMTIEDAMDFINVEKDFSSNSKLNYIHFRNSDKEFYFLANPLKESVNALCEFRVGYDRAQIWDPETGKKYKLDLNSKVGNGICSSNIYLGSEKSLFVVFGLPVDESLPEWKEDKFTVVQEISGKWNVSFLDGLGAPENIEFTNLIPWNQHIINDIKYYSGKASYKKSIDLSSRTMNSKRIMLDLGEVAVMAKVMVNGKDAGILWRHPFIIDISQLAKKGKNEIEVTVVNLWPNRLIGDEQFPDDIGYDTDGTMSKWPDWLINKKERTTERKVFSARKQWNSDDKLLPSGLIGPVRILVEQ